MIFYPLDFFDTDLCVCVTQNMGMSKQAVLAILSPYEASIIRGTQKSKADVLTEGKRTQAIVNNMLKCKDIVELPDGTSVEVTIEELLIATSIQKELENPKGLETVEKLMKIRGELEDKGEVQLNVSLVDKDLAKRALD